MMTGQIIWIDQPWCPRQKSRGDFKFIAGFIPRRRENAFKQPHMFQELLFENKNSVPNAGFCHCKGLSGEAERLPDGRRPEEIDGNGF